MSTPRRSEDGRTGNWIWAMVPMAAVICCGLPLFIGAIGLTAAGAFLTVNRYWIFGGLVLLMGLILLVVSRKGKKAAARACDVKTSMKKESCQSK